MNCESFFSNVEKPKTRLWILIKEAMLYVCYGKFAGYNFLEITKMSTRKVLVFWNYLSGWSLYKYWSSKYKEKNT